MRHTVVISDCIQSLRQVAHTFFNTSGFIIYLSSFNPGRGIHVAAWVRCDFLVEFASQGGFIVDHVKAAILVALSTQVLEFTTLTLDIEAGANQDIVLLVFGVEAKAAQCITQVSHHIRHLLVFGLAVFVGQ